MQYQISNLESSIRDAELINFLASLGIVPISVSVEYDHFSEKSRGFAVVEFGEDVPKTSIDQLNGKELLGLELKVAPIQPVTNRPPRIFPPQPFVRRKK